MDTRQLLVVSTGAASGLWLVSNVFIYEIGRSMWLVDELPEGGISMFLFKAGVLRPRRQTEQYPKMVSLNYVRDTSRRGVLSMLVSRFRDRKSVMRGR